MFWELILWFDRHPHVYWWVGCAALAWLLWESLAPAFQRATQPKPAAGCPEWRYCLSVVVMVVAWRWPFLLYAAGMSPDESQQLAGALTLTSDPVFWRSVDGHTAGPVNFYALTLPAFVGAPIQFWTGRLVALGLIIIAMFCLYRTLKRHLSLLQARSGLLPGLLFFAFVVDWDFLHVTTEHVPIALLSGSVYALSVAVARPGNSSPGWYLLSGVLAGLVPWAKLQGAPAAFCVAAAGAFFLLRRQNAGKTTQSLAAAFLLGLAFPSIVFVAMIFSTGQWNVFHFGYISGNVSYVQEGRKLSEVAVGLWNATTGYGTYPAIMVLCMVAGLVGLWPRRREAGFSWPYALAIVAVGVSAFLVLAPRRVFLHYLLFTILPLTAFAAIGVARLGRTLQPTAARLASVTFALATVACLLGVRFSEPLPYVFRQIEVFSRVPQTAVAAKILQYSERGDRLGVWGWNTQVYVETQLPQATRDAHTQRAMDPSPIREKALQRYLLDLEQARPAVFVDAVGPGAFAYTDRDLQGHETVRRLRAFIRANYARVAELNSARVYVRLDRLQERESLMDAWTGHILPGKP